MAVFEEIPPKESYFDDTSRLFCTITNSRIIDGHVEYILKVQKGYNKDNNWTLFKRYSEFVDLHKDIRASYYDINLPPKKFFGNLDRQFITDRQQRLQSYMNKVLDHIILSSSIYLKRFLEPDNYHPSIQENGFQDASMALRGKTDFHNMKPLPNIGWRFNKQYCNVKRLNVTNKECILTWISHYGMRTCLTDKELQSAFKVLLELSHPYIMPIVTGTFYSKGALIIRTCCTKGSLREWIYQKTAYDSFLDKCRYRDERFIIPSVEVSTISIQILNALIYLHKKNIPYGNLHTGNIFFEDNVAKISEVENGIFGLPSFFKRFLIENRRIRSLEDVDVYLFGHVLYEMAFGERLDSCFCDAELLDCYENLRPVLRLLLSSSLDNELPNVSELLTSNAFSSGSSKIRTEAHCKLTSQTKQLMAKCKKNIEDTLLKEQNELRKHRKIMRLQEEVEAAEKFDCTIRIKEKRKSRKSSQPTIRTPSSDQFENMSNSSTRTSFSTDSSSPNSGCDKSHETNGIGVTKNVPDSSGTSPSSESTSRNVFLQSIISFDKKKLHKASSNVT